MKGTMTNAQCNELRDKYWKLIKQQKLGHGHTLKESKCELCGQEGTKIYVKDNGEVFLGCFNYMNPLKKCKWTLRVDQNPFAAKNRKATKERLLKSRPTIKPVLRGSETRFSQGRNSSRIEFVVEFDFVENTSENIKQLQREAIKYLTPKLVKFYEKLQEED